MTARGWPRALGGAGRSSRRPPARRPPARRRWVWGRPPRVARLVVGLLALSAATAGAVAGGTSSSTGRAGLRFGIYPGGSAGSAGAGTAGAGTAGAGTASAGTAGAGTAGAGPAGNAALGLAALEALRPGPTRGGERPFVLHLYDAFTDQPGVDAFNGTGANGTVSKEISRYVRHGFLVELVLRYEPAPGPRGNEVAAFAAFVRRAVTYYAAGSKVAFLQVTNEANVLGSPQSSDGAYPGAWQALVAGVEAARSQARRLGSSMQVGFNWAYGQGKAESKAFWSYLGAQGPAWRASVQWIGLDVYPGTFPRTSIPPARTGAVVVKAVAQLRRLAAPAGLGASIPLHLSELGYPTGPSRTYGDQAIALRSMVDALARVRTRYDVTDVRWFDLRDADTAAPGLQDHYGLMTSSYGRKPAFQVYRQLVRRLTMTTPSPSGG